MITDERLSDLYFEVLGVRLAEFDAVPVHAFMRAVEKLAREDERRECAKLCSSRSEDEVRRGSIDGCLALLECEDAIMKRGGA